ncbi:transcriptional repressor LexA [Patescibacteria group bacterium]|nr:transcriptional repressor LexA [Patescibacteria group bacterium]
MQDIKPLTGKQKKTLDFINSFLRKKGFSPSLHEIAEYLGKNLSTAQYYVNELEEKGYLTKNANKARGISPINNQHNIPLLGYIAAGKPIEPIENPEEILIPANIEIDSRYPHYALKIKGDSMIDMGILDKDIVLIKHQMTANNGEVVVAITENGATLKVFRKSGGKITLEPRNKDYPVIEPHELEIRGKFVGLIRNS